MITCRRVFLISTVPRGSFGKPHGSSFTKAFQKNQIYPNTSVPRAQFRTSTFARENVSGGKGFISRTTPVKKESVVTLTRVAYAVKLVRFPFLLVAISSIGYQRGGRLVLELFLALSL